MEWGTIVGQPIVQLGGVFLFLAGLQRSGFDVIGGIASLLRIPHREDIDADNRNVGQTLLTQMQTLSEHFNHDTTDNQMRIEEEIAKMHEKQDAVVQLLREIKEYGIKCRKE